MQREFLETIDDLSGSRKSMQSAIEKPLTEATSKRLIQMLDAYHGSIRQWTNNAGGLSLHQRLPSSTTITLFGLAVFLTIVINGFVTRTSLPVQYAVWANLGCVWIMLVAGLSLFYDRVVRGYGYEGRRKETMVRFAELSDQWLSVARVVRDVESQLNDAKEVLDIAELEIANRRSLAQQIQVQIDTSNSQIAANQGRLASLCRDLMDEASRLSRCQHSVATLEHQKQELEKTIEAHSDKLFEVAERHEDLCAAVSAIEHQKKAFEERLAIEKAEGEVEIRTLNSEVTSLRSERSAQSAQLSEIRRELAELGDERTELHCELDLLREEYGRNRAANLQSLTDLRGEIQSLQSEKNSMGGQVVALRSQIEDLHEQRNTLGTQVEEFSDAKERLEADLSSLTEQLVDRQQSLTSLESAMQSEIAIQEERREAARIEANEIESLRAESDLVLQEIERSVRESSLKRQSLASEVEQLQEAKLRLESSVGDLNDRLLDRSSELERNYLQIHEVAEHLEKLSQAIRCLSELEQPGLGTNSDRTVDEEIRSTVDDQKPQVWEIKPTEFQGPHWDRMGANPLTDYLRDDRELTRE